MSLLLGHTSAGFTLDNKEKSRKPALRAFGILYLAETEGFEPSSRKPANAFRVRPVMTTSIRLHVVRVLFDYKSRVHLRQGAYTLSARKALVFQPFPVIVYFLCLAPFLYC